MSETKMKLLARLLDTEPEPWALEPKLKELEKMQEGELNKLLSTSSLLGIAELEQDIEEAVDDFAQSAGLELYAGGTNVAILNLAQNVPSEIQKILTGGSSLLAAQVGTPLVFSSRAASGTVALTAKGARVPLTSNDYGLLADFNAGGLDVGALVRLIEVQADLAENLIITYMDRACDADEAGVATLLGYQDALIVLVDRTSEKALTSLVAKWHGEMAIYIAGKKNVLERMSTCLGDAEYSLCNDKEVAPLLQELTQPRQTAFFVPALEAALQAVYQRYERVLTKKKSLLKSLNSDMVRADKEGDTHAYLASQRAELDAERKKLADELSRVRSAGSALMELATRIASEKKGARLAAGRKRERYLSRVAELSSDSKEKAARLCEHALTVDDAKDKIRKLKVAYIDGSERASEILAQIAVAKSNYNLLRYLAARTQPRACYELAEWEKRKSEKIFDYKVAAGGGNEAAIVALARYYSKEVFKKSNPAMEYVQTALPLCHYVLEKIDGSDTDMLENAGRLHYYIGDEATAVELLARAGTHFANYLLGSIYHRPRKGGGVRKNLTKAKQCLNKAGTSAEVKADLARVQKEITAKKKREKEKAPNIFDASKNYSRRSETYNYSGGGGLCFITTAVCKSFDKPDDCYELTAFRAFRDNYLRSRAGGAELIRRYYAIAPEIVRRIDASVDPARIYRGIWDTYLAPCLAAIESGDNEACLERYQDMVLTLAQEYNVAAENN